MEEASGVVDLDLLPVGVREGERLEERVGEGVGDLERDGEGEESRVLETDLVTHLLCELVSEEV